ncbi:MAG: hypothetical protein V7727_17070 [Sneathiella sp.]
MSDLIAGITSSSVYNTYTNTLFSTNSNQATVQSSSQSIREASFTFDAIFLEEDRPSIVSMSVGAVDEVGDTMLSSLAEKIAGFLEPFGKSGEDLKKTIGSVLETIGRLLQITSEDANAISIEINLARIEESFSIKGGASSASATISGFALDISVATAEMAYNPDQTALVKLNGSQIKFGHINQLLGDADRVFQLEASIKLDAPTLQSRQEESVDEAKHIVEFLKNTAKQIDVFNTQEENAFRDTVTELLAGRSAVNYQV